MEKDYSRIFGCHKNEIVSFLDKISRYFRQIRNPSFDNDIMEVCLEVVECTPATFEDICRNIDAVKLVFETLQMMTVTFNPKVIDVEKYLYCIGDIVAISNNHCYDPTTNS